MERNETKAVFGVKRDIWIICLLFVISLFSWFFAIDKVLADDSYFYLVVARNIVQHGSHTFSGFINTNGFHPFWGYLLTGYSAAVNAVNPEFLQSVYYALPLQIFLLAVTVTFFWKFAKIINLHPLLLVVIPLFYITQFYNLYSELPLVMTMTAITCWYYAKIQAEKRRNTSTMIRFGVLCAGLMLSRLDLFFLVAPFLALDFYYHRDRYTFVAGLAASVCMMPYLIINKIIFGGFVPVSGTMKSTFPNIGFREGIDRHWADRTIFGCNFFFGIFPTLVGGCVLLRLKQPRVRFYLAAFWTAAVLALAYLALFTATGSFTYRPWYYGSQIALISIAFAAVLPVIFPRRLKLVFLFLTGAFVSLAIIFAYLPDRPALVVSKCYTKALQDCPPDSTILVSDFPGVLAFTYPDKHIITADMLMANMKLYNRMMQSDNTLEFLIQYCKAQNHPLDFFFCMSSGPLQYIAVDKTVRYHDPKIMYRRNEKGRISVTTTPVPVLDGWLVPTEQHHTK